MIDLELEQFILSQFLDLNQEQTKTWINLLKNSLAFSPSEKCFFILNFNGYSVAQKNRFIEALEKERKEKINLKKTFSKEYRKRQKLIQDFWQATLKMLEKESKKRANAKK